MSEENKKNVSIDLTSTLGEKAIDLAKNFLEKLIMPSIEQAGLLVKDKLTFWRFKNQITILNKAKVLCESQGIKTKEINLKLLAPFLENASLEDDDLLQDKWAQLLANLVDSEQNIENHVFPYLLSQISKGEFISLDTSIAGKRVEETSELRTQIKIASVTLRDKRINLERLKIELPITTQQSSRRALNRSSILRSNIKELAESIIDDEKNVLNLMNVLKGETLLNAVTLLDFELENLKRLGLIDRNEDFYITDLGFRFMAACRRKKN